MTTASRRDWKGGQADERGGQQLDSLLRREPQKRRATAGGGGRVAAQKLCRQVDSPFEDLARKLRERARQQAPGKSRRRGKGRGGIEKSDDLGDCAPSELVVPIATLGSVSEESACAFQTEMAVARRSKDKAAVAAGSVEACVEEMETRHDNRRAFCPLLYYVHTEYGGRP